MKALGVFALAIYCTLAASAQNAERAATEPDSLAGTDVLLLPSQEHRHPTTIPLSLPELESAALANNPEILAAMRRITVVEARRGSAGSLEDPSFMYRGWGTPLSRPWDLNQTQHMFMFSQSLPGGGKRELRTQVADADIDIAKLQVEAKKFGRRRGRDRYRRAIGQCVDLAVGRIGGSIRSQSPTLGLQVLEKNGGDDGTRTTASAVTV